MEEFVLCPEYLKDKCLNQTTCPYKHKDFPCKYYHIGLLCPKDDECKYMHGSSLSVVARDALLKHIKSKELNKFDRDFVKNIRKKYSFSLLRKRISQTQKLLKIDLGHRSFPNNKISKLKLSKKKVCTCQLRTLNLFRKWLSMLRRTNMSEERYHNLAEHMYNSIETWQTLTSGIDNLNKELLKRIRSIEEETAAFARFKNENKVSTTQTESVQTVEINNSVGQMHEKCILEEIFQTSQENKDTVAQSIQSIKTWSLSTNNIKNKSCTTTEPAAGRAIKRPKLRRNKLLFYTYTLKEKENMPEDTENKKASTISLDTSGVQKEGKGNIPKTTENETTSTIILDASGMEKIGKEKENLPEDTENKTASTISLDTSEVEKVGNENIPKDTDNETASTIILDTSEVEKVGNSFTTFDFSVKEFEISQENASIIEKSTDKENSKISENPFLQSIAQDWDIEELEITETEKKCQFLKQIELTKIEDNSCDVHSKQLKENTLKSISDEILALAAEDENGATKIENQVKGIYKKWNSFW